jgi:glucokinase
MILAGDIGGTNTRLGLFEVDGSRLLLRREQTFASQDHPNLESVVLEFLGSAPLKPEYACFGVAGPVNKGRCEALNLAWVVDASVISRSLAIAHVAVINDLEANAHGISELAAGDLVTLAPGAPDAEGNRAVIAAGTGLGEAGIYWDGGHYHPFATEGGHADFAPCTDLEQDLCQYLVAQFGHVSYERVLSGPGLFSIYEFLRDTGRGYEPAWLAAELTAGDPAALIAGNALAGRASLAVHALDVFVSIYGAEAGNLALKIKATGGLFVGGGIAPKIIRKIQEPAFMKSFTAKGRIKPLLESMPVHVIMNDRAALWGAARFASQLRA